ncbi:DeoR/GlpR family DNA-binding transcription regulator [Roseibium marinum]|uniref:DeoR family glycerol-3-phosphate regulon repressor n=1 Tax=Roseibium marinum TaxID=281252 RepID=A0A2S3UML3_9HYPH|nr:DeoR/GlpR family DNA-binding transcription regulator [Roseibium marinum]POF28921.1 DeoR family glycerol-3-phosphate regulon repressor [Roseibium marinum]
MTDSSTHTTQDKSTKRGRPPAQARLAAILDRLNQGGSVSVAEFAQEFGVSDMTVRRDLAELEGKGLLERVHGGAVSLQHGPLTVIDDVEPVFEARRRLNSDAKSRIAQAAVRLIADHQTLAFDLGTTVLAGARALISSEPAPGLRIFTNSLRVAQLTAAASVQTYVPGGLIQPGEMSVTGQAAVENFTRYYFDAALIGASGLTPDGVFDYSPEEAAMKSVYIQRSSCRILMIDSSKFRRISTVRVADLAQISIMVTDAAPPPELAQALEEANVSILIA